MWSAVDTQAWQANVTDPAFLDAYSGPFLLCFADIIRHLRTWSAHEADGEAIAPVFAEQNQHTKQMFDICHAYMATKPRSGRFFRSLTFSSPVDCIPLQVADVLAWLVRDEWTGRDFLSERELHARAFEGSPKAYGAFFDEGSLIRAVHDFRAGRGAFGDGL